MNIVVLRDLGALMLFGLSSGIGALVVYPRLPGGEYYYQLRGILASICASPIYAVCYLWVAPRLWSTYPNITNISDPQNILALLGGGFLSALVAIASSDDINAGFRWKVARTLLNVCVTGVLGYALAILLLVPFWA